MKVVSSISVIGLGKLGACTAACFAAKGFRVIGVDVNQAFVAVINQGRTPVMEPQLQDMISASKGRLTATGDYREAIEKTDITFLIIPTPSREDGHFSNSYVQGALTQLASALKKSQKPYHLFVITSTVSPGSCEKEFIPLIEKLSDRKLNQGFGVAYNPEFIALGTVIRDFLNPDLILIGESERRVGDMLEAIYQKTCISKHAVARMSLVSAEIAKISLNAYVTMKISYANTLANICEKIPGANVDDITKAIGADKRISPYYLRGGISFGGPCFPRDNRAFSAFAGDVGVKARLAHAVDQVNEDQVRHLADIVSTHVNTKNNCVAILGLSYKPNTPVIDESPGIKLVEYLLQHRSSLKMVVYDELAIEAARALLGDKVHYATSVIECFTLAATCVLTTSTEEFKAINAQTIVHQPTTLIDGWRMVDPAKLGNYVHYVGVGQLVK